MSENALTVIDDITESKITEYLDSAGITNKLLDNEKKMFLNIAREFRLNPFKREIHITAYGQGDNRKCSIITGYDVYIKRAERTGKLDGWKVWTEGEGKSMKAVVEIYRKDHKYPFTHEVYYTECVQYNKDGYPNAVWAKQPKFMTKKVAIGQAFRLCFPDELGGMPYEESELPNEEPRNVTDEEPPNAPVNEENLAEKYKETMNEIGNIMKSEHDGVSVFTEIDKIELQKEVKASLNKILLPENKLTYIESILDRQKEILQARIFDMEAESPDEFVDDIPGVETQQIPF